MKKIIFLTVLLLSLYIQAQTISITDTPKKIPSGIYLKDMDNTLPLFSGMWVANFDGKQIILDISNRIDKYLKELSVNYYSDVLFIRYAIKDSNGNQLTSTMDRAITNANIISTYPSKDRKRIGFYYRGEACGIGNGLIGLTIIDESHIKWEFSPLGGLIDTSQCSDYSPGIKSYIPRSSDLIFTKQ
ncbi:DUF6705 family protein [Elizabethkingia anophelis]|uniref:DUF6705 family protein n=1 Tax=Elizabethkingia anophelis TaxID=1117645 RepID=UPI001369FB2D|nr:DUF6705 family protein [Elizabethkingia anophelis]MYY43882.1 hypothetical protein [Elizabethkingia anophelis]